MKVLEYVSEMPGPDRDAAVRRNFERIDTILSNLGARVTIGHGAPGAGVTPGIYVDQDTVPPDVYVVV